MHVRSTAAAVVLAALLVGPRAQAQQRPAEVVTYRVQPAGSLLVVHLFKEGIGSRFAHDHVIVARALHGTVQLDPQRPETARVRITAFTDGLDADPPGLRRAHGMPPISDKDRREIAASMRSPGQLDTARHRTIQFASTAVSVVGRGGFEVHGNLTIRGVTRPVRLHVSAAVSERGLKGSGRLTFRQSDFGYKPYRAFLGMVRVRDEAQMDIHLEGASERPAER